MNAYKVFNEMYSHQLFVEMLSQHVLGYMLIIDNF
jgi:hypothetical protein